MQVFIASDHAGFELKEKIFHSLANRHQVEDVGPQAYVSKDDYPGIARAAARTVRNHRTSRGIFICGSGVGMSIVANRVRGIRACIGESAATVRRGRAEDDINVLVLGSRILTFQKAMALIRIFLSTPFSGIPRHVRRVKQIDSSAP